MCIPSHGRFRHGNEYVLREICAEVRPYFTGEHSLCWSRELEDLLRTNDLHCCMEALREKSLNEGWV